MVSLWKTIKRILWPMRSIAEHTSLKSSIFVSLEAFSSILTALACLLLFLRSKNKRRRLRVSLVGIPSYAKQKIKASHRKEKKKGYSLVSRVLYRRDTKQKILASERKKEVCVSF